jgi:hypothetical protein
MKQHICVYCGSSDGSDPVHKAAATRLGQAIAGAGFGLVYGGGDRGLMGAVARAAGDAGAPVTGIIPHFLIAKEQILTDAAEIVRVETMHERKMLMYERADAFVALPGGIGTLEELIEQMTWAQLGRHRKPIVIADVGGFWRPLMDLLAHMRLTGFIPTDRELRTMVAEKVDDVVPMIQSALARHPVSPPLPPL